MIARSLAALTLVAAAGTRDSAGRPGRNYWQLRTDYTINARLDPATSRITGRETIVLRNNGDDALQNIVMRLDQNMFLFNVPRAAPWVPAELTDGMGITRITTRRTTRGRVPLLTRRRSPRRDAAAAAVAGEPRVPTER